MWLLDKVFSGRRREKTKVRRGKKPKGERRKNFVPLPSTLYITPYSFLLKSLSLNSSCFSFPELSFKTDEYKLRVRRER